MASLNFYGRDPPSNGGDCARTVPEGIQDSEDHTPEQLAEIAAWTKEKDRLYQHQYQNNVKQRDATKARQQTAVASQWMFLQNNTIDRLAEEIQGKMRFIIIEAIARSPTATA
ncbi:uncharacterized protein CDV56_105981 [Aspergillus thermomutatus]|uniref:Uncharacterized protein n=1 Tax=Aspergillus thermomutatus TaxID=41047 RepID=A0A397GYC6_ASPTH|nr:uncharacterized protein CDV56_105981 [Aspergillus thermomutatus]RHZ55657.1 hypothetical protein CDV56_105981 [Aspergillus thermomutatus]